MKHAHKAPVAFALLFPCERLSFGENDIASRVRLETDLDARRGAVVFSSAKSYGNISTVVVLKLHFSGPVWMKGGSVPEMYYYFFFSIITLIAQTLSVAFVFASFLIIVCFDPHERKRKT